MEEQIAKMKNDLNENSALKCMDSGFWRMQEMVGGSF
jgi:hypothetical protein